MEYDPIYAAMTRVSLFVFTAWHGLFRDLFSIEFEIDARIYPHNTMLSDD